jgi:uncharacterized protein YkwD
LGRGLDDPSPQARAAAIEALLAMGRAGRRLLAEGAAARIGPLRERLVRQCRGLPRVATAALEAHAAWQKAVQASLRETQRAYRSGGKDSREMRLAADRAVKACELHRSQMLTAVKRTEPLEAGIVRLNQYEQARHRADRSYRPRTHKLYALVLAAGGKQRYPVAFDKLLADHRRTEKIARWVAQHNRKHKDKMDAQEFECLGLLNSYRRKMGCVPLTLHRKLHEAARQHAKEMHDLSYFSHRSPVRAYATPARRAAMAGYTAYRNLGENIATSFGASMVHRQFRTSPVHHLNMLNPTWREVGIGRHGRHWTQMFGLRRKNPWDGSPAPPPKFLWRPTSED